MKRKRKWVKFQNNTETGRFNSSTVSSNSSRFNVSYNALPLEDIVRNNDRVRKSLKSSESLKWVTDNRIQRKKRKSYADVVVNRNNDTPTFDKDVGKPNNENTSTYALENETDRRTDMSSEQLKGIYDLLMYEKSSVLDPSSPVLLTNSSVSCNASNICKTQSSINEDEHEGVVSNLDQYTYTGHTFITATL